METSLFWDAQENQDGTLDRVYNSDDFAAMFLGFWGDGIIPNVSTALLVEPIENSFAVVVNPGDAFIKGRFYQNTKDKQFTLANGNAQERVDYIALRFDSEKRSVYLKYLEGAEGEGNPLYARSAALFDLLLAKITIPANAQYLTDEMVEDLRGTSDCPWINLRFDLDAITSSFQSWYDGVRELLDEDVAAQLQGEIDALETKHNEDVALIKSKHSQDVQSLNATITSLNTQVTSLNSQVSALQTKSTELQNKLNQERKYDNVIKNGNIYINTRPYDASIDTDIP